VGLDVPQTILAVKALKDHGSGVGQFSGGRGGKCQGEISQIRGGIGRS
jgi:hypothetical protein